MKILKYILLTIVALAALVLIVALFLPRTFHAGSQITIDRPSAEVFTYVSTLKNQGNYDAWSKQDPHMEKKYNGTDGAVGFTYEWKSKKVGDGKQIITHIEPGKRIDMNLYFQGSDVANPSFIDVKDLGPTQSLVTWEIDGTMPYPFHIMHVFYDMNKDFDAGLQNLKAILEKQ
ncbi:SRPBCC family protein [Sphingobacterium paludis]|uniref:Polyketide cyclase/dehydrase/lipid transport protein n=1 Tax=Sphingobacterium paludis TaxID=1476465 RepID=A0A4R7CU25_9SPHI|nr:SRPBCC family protein [Sphingobacterium paludis]TDS11929.1 polyketide cyclase/dehydrase/lipid transport protein [Sphingobacterium paludis]